MAAKVWDLVDIIILVTWLDFCIERGIDFQNDIISLLRESRRQRTGQEYPFTIKQVEDKLVDLSRKDLRSASGRDSKDYPRLNEIYTRGSACFPRQTNELRPQIGLALEQFQVNYPHSGRQEGQRSDRGGNKPNIRSVDLEEESALPDQWIVEVSTNLKVVLDIPTTNIARNSMERNYPQNATVYHQAPAQQTGILSSNQTNIEIRKGYAPVKGAWQSSLILDHRQDPVGRTERLWEEVVTALHGRIADLEKKNEGLRAMVQSFDTARQQSESAGHDPKSSQFRIYHQELWALQQLNINLENAADFFKLEANENRSLQVEHIDESMEEIQAELESVLGNCDTTNLQVCRTVERDSDLEALLISCLKLHQKPEQLDTRLKECISQFEVPILVRAVVLAALNDWIFITSFPPFEREGSTSLFLKSIEEIALEHSDWAWLRNLETAAFSRFLKRSEFTEGLLPMKSRLLADRLINATASLIGPITSEIEVDDRPTAIDSILESLHARYIKLFSAGLKFKATTAATDNRYEFVLKLPGTMTGEQGRESAPRSSFTTRESFRMTGAGKSWFHASLKVYDAGPANWINPRTDAIIQTDNFVLRASKINSPCVYQKDILIERSDIEDNSSSLQMHNTMGTSGRQLLSAPLHFQLNTPDTGLQSRNGIKVGLEQGINQSFQSVSHKSSNMELEQNQAAYTQTKQVVPPPRQVDSYDRSQSESTVAEDSYGVDSRTWKKQEEGMRSKGVSFGTSTSDTKRSTEAFVCRKCGTPLSTNDCLRRHEKNGSCRRCKICVRTFWSNEALKKHQLSDHPRDAKRQRLSQEGTYANNESSEPNNNHVCQRCNREFTQTNLERHLKNKSCSRCFKCGAEFDTGDEFYSHMKLTHSVEFSKGHWRNCPVGDRGEESTISRDLPAFNNPEQTTHTLSQPTTNDEAPAAPETSMLPPSDAQNEQAKDLPETTPIESGFQDMEADQEATPVIPSRENHYCSICNDTFVTQLAFDRHKGRQRHRTRMREIKNASAIEQGGSLPDCPSAPAVKGMVQDKTLKGRIEKQSRSRAFAEIRREPNPPTRHVGRIIASLGKVCDFVSPSTSSAKANKQQTASIDAGIAQDVEERNAKTIGSDSRDKAAEKAQILRAPANFGGQFSAPPRTFENVAAGLGSPRWGRCDTEM